MKKFEIAWLVCTVLLMLVAPAILLLLKDTVGSGPVVILVLRVDPVYSLITGALTGWAWKKRWWMPLVCVALYLAGAWLFVAPFEFAFVQYTAVCLALSSLGMLVTGKIKDRRKRR